MNEVSKLPAAAKSGFHVLPGQVWRRGDANKHLGPPEGLGIDTWSRLFQTRCGLGADTGNWAYTKHDDDAWCPDCLKQAGIGFALYDEDTP